MRKMEVKLAIVGPAGAGKSELGKFLSVLGWDILEVDTYLKKVPDKYDPRGYHHEVDEIAWSHVVYFPYDVAVGGPHGIDKYLSAKLWVYITCDEGDRYDRLAHRYGDGRKAYQVMLASENKPPKGMATFNTSTEQPMLIVGALNDLLNRMEMEEDR